MSAAAARGQAAPNDVPALAGVAVRVSAEIGRARLLADRVVNLGPGTVVELDRGADDLAELYVNGRRFGAGRLILVDGEWALRIEWVSGTGAVESASSGSSAT
ncbi:MAG: FliM/FliN family flagellar motor C-terminal domain-containing protein [Actinobacteria bacterium]|nr:FliM/FliN family flagellar motor C-terminal domain-containing protein [Actinomycetota bacterium]